MRATLLPLFLVLMLAACASPPPVRTLDPALLLPDQWTVAVVSPDEVVVQRWWEAFEDPALDAVVRETLANNYELDVAVANVQAARASATIAGADRWPQVRGSARGSRSQQVFVGLPIPGQDVLKSLSTSYGLSLEASWEIDLWNRLGEQQKAAVAELQATEADLAAARLSVAGLATESWLNLTELQVQLALADRTLAAFRRTEELATDRYRRGLITAVDVHLARTSAEEAAALRALRLDQVQRSSRQLEILMGRYPSGELTAGNSLPNSVPDLPAALPADLLVRRPDLIAAERRLVASGARVSAARRNLLPRISLSGSSGTTSNDLGDLLNGDFSVWSLAANLAQPLFQGGRLRAQVSLSAAGEDAALAAYVLTAMRAFGEVESALASEAHLAEREVHLRSALESAARAWQLSEDRYRQGIGTLLSVLEAQRRALNAESQLITVRNDRLKARVTLHRALGGGFDPDQPGTQFLLSEIDDSNPSESE